MPTESRVDAQDSPSVVRPPHVMTRLARSADLLLCAALLILAVFAVGLLPEGSVLRVVLVAPAVFVVPGYLLIQAFVVREKARRSRLAHVLIGIGISPAVVGLFALATALIDGAFKQAWIVVAVTLLGLLLAVVADYRRSRLATAGAHGASVGGTLAAPSIAPAPSDR